MADFGKGDLCSKSYAAQAKEAVELEKTVVTATRTETLIENLQASVTVITKGGTFNSYIGNARLNAATRC